jgi:hypothetical protein
LKTLAFAELAVLGVRGQHFASDLVIPTGESDTLTFTLTALGVDAFQREYHPHEVVGSPARRRAAQE